VEIEERAKQMGWTEKEDFRGNPDNWVDADTFVSRAETSLPIAKGTIKRLESEVGDLKKTLGEFSEFYKGAEKRAYDKAIKDLQSKEIEAVEEGDTEKFKKVRNEYADLIQSHPMAAMPQGAIKSPASPADNQEVINTWIEANPWYTEDFEMHEYANKMDKFIGMKKSNRTPEEHMAAVLASVKEKFPDHFGNGASKRSAPSIVEGGESLASTGNAGRRSYSNLPSWAKEQCDRFTKDKLMTREQYCKDYSWD
jgi:hypothetical protein